MHKPPFPDADDQFLDGAIAKVGIRVRIPADAYVRQPNGFLDNQLSLKLATINLLLSNFSITYVYIVTLGRINMGDFRSGSRGRSGGGFGGGRSSQFGRPGGRSFGSREGPREMHDVICSKCNAKCQVPFKPTGNKPVLCSDCFRQEGGGRDRDSGRSFSRNESSGSSGSSDQLKRIETKLDRIIKVLQELEIDTEDEETEEEEEVEEAGEEVAEELEKSEKTARDSEEVQ